MAMMGRSAKTMMAAGRTLEKARAEKYEAGQGFAVHFANKDGSPRKEPTGHHDTLEKAQSQAAYLAKLNPKSSAHVVDKASGSIAHTTHGEESPHKAKSPAQQHASASGAGGEKASKLKAFAEQAKGQQKMLQKGKKGGMFFITSGGQKSYIGKGKA